MSPYLLIWIGRWWGWRASERHHGELDACGQTHAICSLHGHSVVCVLHRAWHSHLTSGHVI